MIKLDYSDIHSFEGEMSPPELKKRVIRFLLSQYGQNPRLAEHIKHKSKYLIGPIDFPFKDMIRICGPEPDMKYPEPAKVFDKQVSKIQHLVEGGWKPQPLIATRFWGLGNEISDGSHRLEALKSLGYKSYLTIFCFDTKAKYDEFMKEKA